MSRKFIAAALFLSTVAAAHESTILEQLRYSMYRYQGISRGFPVKVQIDNVKPEDALVLNRVYPFPGEEGQFTGVRFTPKKTFGVSEVDFTAPNGAKFGVNCTVDEDRIVNLYVITDSTPDNNALPDVSVVVPGQVGVADGNVLFTVTLSQPLWIQPGESVFVAIEHPGVSPDVGCLTTAAVGPDDKEQEFWSYATSAPNNWTGFEDLGIYEKPLVSVSGTMVF